MSPDESSVLVDLVDLPRTTYKMARVAVTSGTCFENCSPLRTRCPGPTATFSRGSDGRWAAICRLTADCSSEDLERNERGPS